MSSPEILKPRPISGFPEWMPNPQSHQDQSIKNIAQIFESFGFLHIETAAVELNDVLCAKGVENKEIYSLKRIQAEADEKSKFSLHFDLTVPFARYVAMNQGQLTFPFKRYQIQKVWRGERPAKGRFREFYQCDIDIVGMETLSINYEAEVIDIMSEVFKKLDIGNVAFKLNHRKLLEGFYNSIDITGDLFPKVLIEVDKIEKIGVEKMKTVLTDLDLNDNQILKIIEFAELKCDAADFESIMQRFNCEDKLFKEGVDELNTVFNLITIPEGFSLQWCGSITRGLNYYTGCIFETEMENAPELGSICSGGRYENLCGRFSKSKLPGVGISLGLTRLLSHLFSNDLRYNKPAFNYSNILIAPFDHEQYLNLKPLASSLRAKGLKVEMSPPVKLKKNMSYADKKNIPFVIIPNDDNSFELKDMEKGEQHKLSHEELLDYKYL
jgi:histidyl-tRNA synthetase